VVIDDNVTAREIPTDKEIISIEDGDSETEPVFYAQAITITFVDSIISFLEQ